MQTRSSQIMWRAPLHIFLFSCFLLSTLLTQAQAGQTPDGLSDQEWGNIQQQVMMNRYKAFAQEDGSYASANIANKQKPLEKKQYKLNTIPAYVRTARIARVACPLHRITEHKN